MPTALVVLAHPRRDSLTARVADRTRIRLESAGFVLDLLDLHGEGFDPRMTTVDEPDWANPDKEYSAEVQAHMRRIDVADTIVVVFPVWWFSVPAIVKGWIDRVWNNGYAYGTSKPRLAGKRMLWLGLAGGSREYFAKDGMDELLDRQLRVGVSNFCGIQDAEVRIVHDTLEPIHPQVADAVLDEFVSRGLLGVLTAG